MTESPWRSRFPHPDLASPEGVVAVGAAPTPELLMDAYQHGIFPWPHEGLPLLWFSPDPRYVILPDLARVPRSLKKAMRKTDIVVRADRRFSDVMQACADVPRPGQNGTWITEDMRHGYEVLFDAGFAHSIEAYIGDELVGGLYGVSFGAAFFGESMFARRQDSSKIAFATVMAQMFDNWGFEFIDCQVHTDHLARFGGVHIPRDEYLERLQFALQKTPRRGPWFIERAPADAVTYFSEPG